MIYKQLKNLIAMYLTGDNQLSTDEDKVSAAIESSFIELSNKATAMKLLTANKSADIIRQGPGGLYIRMPKLPVDDDDVIDVDNELVPVVARLVASYVSKAKGGMHRAMAYDGIRDYEAKVESYILSQEEAGEYNSDDDTYKYTDF